MKALLKDLVEQHLQYPNDQSVNDRILALAPNQHDFTDELLDSFDAEGRMRIYPMLLIWCRREVKELVARRTNLERDQRCKSVVDLIGRCVDRNRSRASGSGKATQSAPRFGMQGGSPQSRRGVNVS